MMMKSAVQQTEQYKRYVAWIQNSSGRRLAIGSLRSMNAVDPKFRGHGMIPRLWREQNDDNKKVNNAVKNLYTCMVEADVSYGFLTTYEYTWFVHRAGEDMYFSEPVAYDSTSPSVLKCFAYLGDRLV